MNDWKAQKAARESAAKAMQAAFPNLVPVSEKVDSLNAAAKNMRIELKAAFPGIKFSVKSRRFSGGDAIDVSWTDGPMAAQVDEIIDRYTAGSFNGMDDSYTYARDAWTDAFGDAKYISSQRKYSAKAVASAIRTVRAKYGANLTEAGVGEVTPEAYESGEYFNLNVIPGGWNNTLQGLIGNELSRRTWALTKKAEPAQAEAVAA